MRSGFVGALATALITSSLLMSGPLARGSPDVLLDEGFEDGVGAWIAGGGILTATSAVAHEGVQSAMFVADSDGNIYRSQIAVQPGRSYSLSAFFFKGDARVQSIAVRLRWEDENHMSIDWSLPVTLAGDEASWRHLTVDGTSPGQAAFVTIEVSILSGAGGILYLDDVEFEGPPPLPATATPAATENPSAEPSSTATPTPTGTAALVAFRRQRPAPCPARPRRPAPAARSSTATSRTLTTALPAAG